MEDLKTHLPDWAFRESIGELVLARMEDADDRWYQMQGKVNPNKIPKVVETKRQAADRYNANKREKRRKLREEEEAKEDIQPVSLDVSFFVPDTGKFDTTPSQVSPSQLPASPPSQPALPLPQPAQLPLSSSQLPLSSSQTLNWKTPLSGLQPKAVRKRRAPNKPKKDASTSTKASTSRSKTNRSDSPVASSSKVRIDDQEASSTSQIPPSEPTALDVALENVPLNAIQEPDRLRPRPRPRPRKEITFDYHMRL